MADTCKLLKEYDMSIRFLKKAIEYSWFIDQVDIECELYDRLGVIHFLNGDIASAKMFHQKSMGMEVEEKTSTLRRYSNEGLKKLMKYENLYRTKHINIMLLAKMGMIGGLYEGISGEAALRNQFKCTTNNPFETVLEMVLKDSDYKIDITFGSNCY